jgi:hypothetical protein
MKSLVPGLGITFRDWSSTELSTIEWLVVATQANTSTSLPVAKNTWPEPEVLIVASPGIMARASAGITKYGWAPGPTRFTAKTAGGAQMVRWASPSNKKEMETITRVAAIKKRMIIHSS